MAKRIGDRLEKRQGTTTIGEGGGDAATFGFYSMFVPIFGQ